MRSARLDGDRSRRLVRRRALSSSAVDFVDDGPDDDDPDADALPIVLVVICDRRRGFRCESPKKRTTLVRDDGDDDDGPFDDDDDDAVDEDAMRSVDIIDIIADGWTTSPLSHDERRRVTHTDDVIVMIVIVIV